MPEQHAGDTVNLIGNWNYPTSVRFGAGRIRELGAAVKAAGMARPLLVTDANLARMPILKRAMQALADEGVAATLFCDVQPNPVAANVEAGLKVVSGGQHDGVVAFGGGSSLDAGKVIAFMAGQRRPIWDFEDVGDWWTRAEATGILPIVAVPTTAGTGSEVGRAGVITDAATHQKKVIFHPLMLPKTSICDPELTLGMPPSTTAGTGMDALAHCLEAYCGAAYHPLADGIGVEGIRLVKENLIRAYRDGSDLEARAYMMSAALMGATAFQKALGAIHALSHPVGALYDTHHGLTNAVFMPYVLSFNRVAIEDRITRLAAYVGLEASFDAFLSWVLALRAEIGIPHTLASLGVDDRQFDRMSEMAPLDPTAGGNPIPIDARACRRLYENAYLGSL
jgi:alcohol dehydrogenase class IV